MFVIVNITVVDVIKHCFVCDVKFLFVY